MTKCTWCGLETRTGLLGVAVIADKAHNFREVRKKPLRFDGYIPPRRVVEIAAQEILGVQEPEPIAEVEAMPEPPKTRKKRGTLLKRISVEATEEETENEFADSFR